MKIPFLHSSVTLGIAAVLGLAGSAVGDPIKTVFIATGGIPGESREIEVGVISVSPDPREWERVFEGGKVKENFTHWRDNLIRALTCEGGKFVAAGNQGIGVMVSENGRDWRFVGSGLDGPGGFCIASTDGKFRSGGSVALDGRGGSRRDAGNSTRDAVRYPLRRLSPGGVGMREDVCGLPVGGDGSRRGRRQRHARRMRSPGDAAAPGGAGVREFDRCGTVQVPACCWLLRASKSL